MPKLTFERSTNPAFFTLFLTAVLSALTTNSLTGCSSASKDAGEEEDFDHSSRVELTQGRNQETVVILGMNDVHGALAPEAAKTRESGDTPPIPYERGGAAYLASQVQVLKKEFGDRLLILDAGDEFQGSIESNLGEGQSMVSYFNALGVQAAAVGNHEFDFGPEGPSVEGDPIGALKKRISEAKYPYVASNIVDKSTRQLPGIPGTVAHYMLKSGRLNVGVIGLTTLETPVTTRQEFVRTLEFIALKDATLIQANHLRKQGAHIVVVVAHAGLHCDPYRGTVRKTHKTLRAPTDPQSECVNTRPDQSREEIVALLHSLPSGTVDAVVSGHSHTLVHHWIAGVPVIQGGTRNQYYNLMYLTYDWDAKKLVTERSRIEGPIPICPKVFANQKDCNGDRPPPRKGRGPLITPVFHGNEITADPEITELLKPVFEKTAQAKKKVLGQAIQKVEHVRTQESPFGNLVSDAIRKSVQADVAIMNGGGIRAPLEQGPITYGDVFRALPFDNAVSLLTVTGRELKDLLRIAETGVRGYFSVSGVQLRILDPSVQAPSNDLNGDRHISPWEINRLLEVRLSDGSPIRDTQMYKVATLDFLVTGGDDMGWIMSKIPEARKKLVAGPIMRDVVVQAIVDLNQRHGGINSAEHPLLDPAHPRLIFDKNIKKPKARSKKSRKASRRKRSGR